MKNNVNLPQCQIKLPGNDFPTDYEKAELFVNMFAQTSRLEGLSDDMKKYREDQEKKNIYKDPTPDNSISFNSAITFSELTDSIESLPKEITAVGIDGISNEMLKHLPHNWLIILHTFLNKCWIEGVKPKIWNKSVIKPILKQGKPKTDKNSYRPIALTCHTGKLMERIINTRLNHHCEKTNTIPPNQAGFRKGRSAVDHLIKLTTQVKYQFARRKNILATFFDLRKAYDQVWHKRLLYKLKEIGITGHMYDYLKGFFIKWNN